MFTNHRYLIYKYKPDLALNKLQWLICYKTKPNQHDRQQLLINFTLRIDAIVS